MENLKDTITQNNTKIREMEILINNYKQQNVALKNELMTQCELEKGHEWIREREEQMYGETYYYCKFCGKDKYSNISYF